jgi:Lhr-like helicases
VAPGPMEIPDHPLVRQTLDDCLHEAMDIDGLRELVAGIEAGRIAVITRDTTEPSVLAHEILNGPPFTYLDDETEAGNRRSRQVTISRGLPVEARDLARLDPDAIEKVREQGPAAAAGCGRAARPADDAVPDAAAAGVGRMVHRARGGRAGGQLPAGLWCATERVPLLAGLYPAEWTFAMAPLPRVKPMEAETGGGDAARAPGRVGTGYGGGAGPGDVAGRGGREPWP